MADFERGCIYCINVRNNGILKVLKQQILVDFDTSGKFF